MTRILTYGTFDLLHIGHLNLLERLSALGDQLIVAVSTDEFNAVKGKKCVMPFAERIRLVGSLKCVSEVFAERAWSQKAHDITRLGIDILAMGDDWEGKFDEFNHLCRVIYLPRTPDISTTAIRQIIAERSRLAQMATA